VLARAEPPVVQAGQQDADPPQHLGHRPAPGLGGVGGQHRVHAQAVQQGAGLLLAEVAAQRGDCGGQ
jgi:hypothetical protein